MEEKGVRYFENIYPVLTPHNYYDGGTTVCRGDSGGGLAIPQKDFEGDQYFLRGVVSTAPKSDHLCNVYAVATFTQITSHEFFIKAALTDARTVADTVTPLIEDTAATTTSPNKTANDPTDKPPVNPLNTDVTDVDTDTDVDDVGIAANKPDRKPPIRPASKPTANKGNKKPNQNKPTGRPPHWWMTETEKPIYDANGILFAVNSELNPELFAQLYPDYYPNNRTLKPGDNPVKNSTYPVTDEISDRFNNKNDTLDINKAITNAPPTESILDNIPNILQRPTNTQEVIENTNNNAPGTTPVRDPTAFVNKPMVSDLLPVNLDQNSNKPAAAEIPVLSSDTTTSTVTSTRKPVPSVPLEFGILDQATQAPVSSIGNADQKPFSPGTLEDHPLVPSLPELVHKPGLAQGPVPSKPSTEKPDHEYRPPHHHQNDPDYNDWKYWHDNWHNDPQNWNNYHHHNCHDHDYHYNWNHHQNWHHQYQDWPNYHRNGNNNQNWQNHHHEWSNDQQNRPNDHQYWQNDYQNQANYQQNWQNHYQNGPNNHRNQRLDDPNRKYEQYLHDLLVQSWFKRN